MSKWPWITAFVMTLLPPTCGAQSTQSTQNTPSAQSIQPAHNILARGVLTNKDVVTLANAGFSELFIIELINTSPQKFDVTADALADLAQNGLTENIIRAIINADRTSKPRVSLAQATPLTHTSLQPPEGIALAEDCRVRTTVNRRGEATFTIVCPSNK